MRIIAGLGRRVKKLFAYVPVVLPILSWKFHSLDWKFGNFILKFKKNSFWWRLKELRLTWWQFREIVSICEESKQYEYTIKSKQEKTNAFLSVWNATIRGFSDLILKFSRTKNYHLLFCWNSRGWAEVRIF